MFGEILKSIHKLASVIRMTELCSVPINLRSFCITFLDYQITGWKTVSNCRNFNIEFALGDEGHSTR